MKLVFLMVYLRAPGTFVPLYLKNLPFQTLQILICRFLQLRERK